MSLLWGGFSVWAEILRAWDNWLHSLISALAHRLSIPWSGKSHPPPHRAVMWWGVVLCSPKLRGRVKARNDWQYHVKYAIMFVIRKRRTRTIITSLLVEGEYYDDINALFVASLLHTHTAYIDFFLSLHFFSVKQWYGNSVCLLDKKRRYFPHVYFISLGEWVSLWHGDWAALTIRGTLLT